MNIDLTYFIPPDNIAEYRKEGPLGNIRETYIRMEGCLEKTRAYMDSYLANSGAKLLRCNPELFEALQDLDLKLRLVDVEQPFPVLLIDFGSVKVMSARFKNIYIVTLYRQRYEYYPIIMTADLNTFRPIREIIFDEDCPAYNILDGNEIEKERDAQRARDQYRDHKRYFWAAVCLNSLLVYSGVLNKEKLKGQGSRRSAPLREIQVIAMKQEHEILEILFNNKRYQHEASEATGRTVRPHWRRAHMRFVRSGVGRVNKALHLIPAVFVNRRLLKGPLTDTEVTFK